MQVFESVRFVWTADHLEAHCDTKQRGSNGDVHVKHKLLAPKSAHSKRMKNKDDKDSLHVVML